MTTGENEGDDIPTDGSVSRKALLDTVSREVGAGSTPGGSRREYLRGIAATAAGGVGLVATASSVSASERLDDPSVEAVLEALKDHREKIEHLAKHDVLGSATGVAPLAGSVETLATSDATTHRRERLRGWGGEYYEYLIVTVDEADSTVTIGINENEDEDEVFVKHPDERESEAMLEDWNERRTISTQSNDCPECSDVSQCYPCDPEDQCSAGPWGACGTYDCANVFHPCGVLDTFCDCCGATHPWCPASGCPNPSWGNCS